MFDIKPASRVGINPLIVAYSESGCGKTYSSLLLARGMAGPTGRIVVADSESGRASLYADVLAGGFETFGITDPFSPARYVEAVDAIESSGAAIGIIDSGSHEHEGPGGVLDMAMENEARSGRAGLHNWKVPKFEHAKYVQRLLRIKIPIIICLRAKYKTRQGKDEKGKTVIIRDDYVSPIAAEDFIFEATAHFQINPNHSIFLSKCSHPSLRDCFPKDNTTPITEAHGRAIAAWCRAAGNPNLTPSAGKSETHIAALKKELWKITSAKHGGDKNAFRQYLVDDCGLAFDRLPEELTETELEALTNKAKEKL